MHVRVFCRQHTLRWFDILQSAAERDHFLHNGRLYHWCVFPGVFSRLSLSLSLNITVRHVISSLQARVVAAGPEIWNLERCKA